MYYETKIKTMLQFLNIIPEVNYQPSSDRWEYKEVISEAKEGVLDLLNRLGYDGWQPETLEYSKVSKRWVGIFKRKLVAI